MKHVDMCVRGIYFYVCGRSGWNLQNCSSTLYKMLNSTPPDCRTCLFLLVKNQWVLRRHRGPSSLHDNFRPLTSAVLFDPARLKVLVVRLWAGPTPRCTRQRGVTALDQLWVGQIVAVWGVLLNAELKQTNSMLVLFQGAWKLSGVELDMV